MHKTVGSMRKKKHRRIISTDHEQCVTSGGRFVGCRRFHRPLLVTSGQQSHHLRHIKTNGKNEHSHVVLTGIIFCPFRKYITLYRCFFRYLKRTLNAIRRVLNATKKDHLLHGYNVKCPGNIICCRPLS